MSLQVSNGFKEQFALFFKSKFDGSVIRVFSGTQPDHSDLAETGTLLGTITLNGVADAGLIFSASGPFIVKDAFASWILTTVATGTATWFRCVADSEDAGGISYSALRFDGSVSEDELSNAEMILDDTALLTGRQYQVDALVYTLPPIISP